MSSAEIARARRRHLGAVRLSSLYVEEFGLLNDRFVIKSAPSPTSRKVG